MKKRIAAAGLVALCAWPALCAARVWVGADVGLAGGAFSQASPIGVYGGLSTRSLPVGIELGYQAYSANPGKVGLFTATALYRAPIPRVAGLHFLARAGIAHVTSGAGAFARASTRPIIGAGVSYHVLRNVNIRAEYDLVIDPRVAGGPSENGDQLLVGATYHFPGT